MFGIKRRKTDIVLAQMEVAQPPAMPTLEETLRGSERELTAADVYVCNVYCCNCSPSFHFDIAILRGVKAEGSRVTCPRCGVAGVVNGMHQVWPVNRGRNW